MNAQSNQLIQVRGIAYWTNVNRVDKYGNWTMELIVDDQTANYLISLGCRPPVLKETNQEKSYPEHPGRVFRFKRKSITATGTKMAPPDLVDSQGKKINILVGNGSEVIVYAIAPRSSEQKHGLLNAIQIIKLVDYKPPEQTYNAIEGGYVAPAQETQPQQAMPNPQQPVPNQVHDVVQQHYPNYQAATIPVDPDFIPLPDNQQYQQQAQASVQVQPVPAQPQPIQHVQAPTIQPIPQQVQAQPQPINYKDIDDVPF